jgi:hypothetical protein
MAFAISTPAPPGAEPYRYQEQADFTGGLNVRADQFNLAENESPDLLNVDVDPRGGVSRRNGITAINSTALSGNARSLFAHSSASYNQIMAAVTSGGNSTLWYATTANFTQISSSAGAVTMIGAVPPRDTSYAATKWSGSGNADRLTPDTDGSDGHFPCARYVATWAQFVWVAYTLESGDYYKNRVRFSKVNDAENWTATDFIDIDIGEDGDFITAIIPDGDRILVFKQNSVYAIYGFGRDSFEVRNVTRSAGCRDGSQPTATNAGIFFWYAEDGVYLLTYDNVVWAFERIKPKIDDTSIGFTNAPSLMWFDERLWVSVDYTSGESVAGAAQSGRRNVFVWDPSLGPIGAWTRYDINARWLWAYRPTGADHSGLAVTSEWSGTAAFTRVAKLNQDTDVDLYDPSGTAVEVFSHYQTGWFSGNRPTFSKRWGKTRTVLLADNTMTVVMSIFKDYDLASETVTLSQTITGSASTATWDTAPSGGGNGVWGTSQWAAAAGTNIYRFFRWPTAGTAKAISLRFSVTPTPSARGKWGLTSAVCMYRTRRLR